MENIFFNSSIISILFILFKYLESKIIVKDNKPIKLIIRDGLIVFISCISGFYILSHINTNIIGKNKPSAFVGEADF
tara:strand:+ start:428 stop:658 length:231 start_codon:yes stop_codon:yes gene_type:complete